MHCAHERKSSLQVGAMHCAPTNLVVAVRSEEHTFELQSHHDLVCRLLLEKKKLCPPPPALSPRTSTVTPPWSSSRSTPASCSTASCQAPSCPFATLSRCITATLALSRLPD